MRSLLGIVFAAMVCALALSGCDAGRTPARPSNIATERHEPSTNSLAVAPIVTTWRCAASGVFGQADCPRPTVHARHSLASAATSAPGAPGGLTSAVTGSTVQLTWTAASGGDAASSYLVEAGSASGLIDLANFDTGNAAVTLTVTSVPAGSYFVRVHARNSAGSGAASNEVIVTVAGSGACATAPGAPTGLAATASGTSVSLSWRSATSGCTPTGYVLEAGSASGLSNLANFNTGSTVTSFSTSGVASGTYFVRVRAASAGGSSSASNEVSFTIGSPTPTPTPPPCTSPSAPAGVSAAASGTAFTLSWGAAAGAPTSYIVDVGTASGASDVASHDTGSTATSLSATLPPGTYFARVRATNACGTSAASDEVTFTITAPAPAVITITSSGVSPKNLTVSPGTQVTFVNHDQIVHDMTSDPHPEHTECSELNQVGFLVPGQSRQTGNLNSVRTCGYHDHTNAFNTAMQGTITIR